MNLRHAIGPLALALAIACPAIAAIPRPEAERAVADVRAALARDGGRLWGVDLNGPILFVDPATHDALGTDPDSAGMLAADGSMFAGGPGWTLVLRPEWGLVSGATPGSWQLAAKK